MRHDFAFLDPHAGHRFRVLRREHVLVAALEAEAARDERRDDVDRHEVEGEARVACDPCVRPLLRDLRAPFVVRVVLRALAHGVQVPAAAHVLAQAVHDDLLAVRRGHVPGNRSSRQRA